MTNPLKDRRRWHADTLVVLAERRLTELLHGRSLHDVKSVTRLDEFFKTQEPDTRIVEIRALYAGAAAIYERLAKDATSVHVVGRSVAVEAAVSLWRRAGNRRYAKDLANSFLTRSTLMSSTRVVLERIAGR